MKEIKYIDSNGNIMNISVIGFFKIPELEKEFIMYSLTDNTSNEYGYVLLGEVVKINDKAQILGILSNEKELVVAYYNEISKQLGEDSNE
ncbi:MAG: hypothetical protein E7168_02750 [Firmicutes bacterium]|nr:hypothetical protein [Bacillota bacterium]